MKEENDKHVDGQACCYTCERFASGAVSTERGPSQPLRVGFAKVRLKITDHRQGTATFYRPTRPEVIFGRSLEADVRLNSLIISRRQSRILFEDDAVFAEDLGSSCGTFVDGQKVQRAIISRGSEINFIDFTVTLEIDP